MDKILFVIFSFACIYTCGASDNKEVYADEPKAEKLTAVGTYNVAYYGNAPYYANHYSYDKYLVPTVAPVYNYHYQNYHRRAYPRYNPYHHGHQHQQYQYGGQHIPVVVGQHVATQHGIEQEVDLHHGIHQQGLHTDVTGLGQYQGVHHPHSQHYENVPPYTTFDYNPGFFSYNPAPVHHSNYYNDPNVYHQGHGQGFTDRRRYFSHNLGYPLYYNGLNQFGGTGHPGSILN